MLIHRSLNFRPCFRMFFVGLTKKRKCESGFFDIFKKKQSIYSKFDDSFGGTTHVILNSKLLLIGCFDFS